VRWEREGDQRRQPTNGGAQRCHATTSKRRGTTRGRGAGPAERQRQAMGNTTTNNRVLGNGAVAIKRRGAD
jgi:hypothetical protein